MRFEAEWLLECFLLRIKSKTCYEHLRTKKILPLPHKDTLRRLLSGMSCHFGFNSVALEAIGKMLHGKSAEESNLVLCMDEMAMQAALEYNTESLTFDGFTRLKDDPIQNRAELQEDEADWDEDNPTEPKEACLKKDFDVSALADHALVFMCRPLLASWVQPFGVFASRSAAAGDDLYRLLIAAIIRLETVGARVLVVTCDGAQPNKSGIRQMAGIGITPTNEEGKEDIIANTMNHPMDKTHQIYCMQDPPHAFKCVRNQMFNHETVQVRYSQFSDLII